MSNMHCHQMHTGVTLNSHPSRQRQPEQALPLTSQEAVLGRTILLPENIRSFPYGVGAKEISFKVIGLGFLTSILVLVQNCDSFQDAHVLCSLSLPSWHGVRVKWLLQASDVWGSCLIPIRRQGGTQGRAPILLREERATCVGQVEEMTLRAAFLGSPPKKRRLERRWGWQKRTLRKQGNALLWGCLWAFVSGA